MDSVAPKMITPEGLERLNALWASFDDIKAVLADITAVGGDETRHQVEMIANKIDAFEPAVTFIGQVKAGKTSLINAMVGQPEFLPTDINPWTSVVTSLHLNSRRRPDGTKALFRFFDEQEWDRLAESGGRLGALARRVGSDQEKENIRVQIDAMRAKTRQRLGDGFERLLGGSHNFDSITPGLIGRYVCHGDWTTSSDSSQGRFADITKIANLYLDLEGYPTGLCLRDTPGVNDTFMMREQITVNAIQDSRLCVVVLSAHQALSSVDMALLRLIANVDAREVVLFVNRIDELDDPTVQIPEIEKDLLLTLKKHDIADTIQIVFGSALWGAHAQSDTLELLPESSGEGFENWANSDRCSAYLEGYEDLRGLVWQLSGIPLLHECIAQRIVAGPGQAMLDEVRDKVCNILTSVEVSEGGVADHLSKKQNSDVDEDALHARLDELEKYAKQALADANELALDNLTERLTRSQQLFVDRAVEALHSHLDVYGTDDVWQYNPAGLRMMLRSAYQAFGRDTNKTTKNIFNAVCRDLESIYVDFFDVPADTINLKPPSVMRLLPPAPVGQTIALDLTVSWWKKWWQNFRGSKIISEHYALLVMEETNTIVSELGTDMAPALCAGNAATLKEFIMLQRTSILALAMRSKSSAVDDEAIGTDRKRTLASTRTLIENLAA